MSQKFLIKTVVGLSLSCAVIAIFIAVISVYLESAFFEPLFNASLSLFTFGCGAVFGLVGSLFVSEQ